MIQSSGQPNSPAIAIREVPPMDGEANRIPFHSPIQRICPSPKRYLQQLIIRHGMRTGLDIGCGADSPLSALRPLGVHSTGLDASAEVIERARELNLHDDYIRADIRTFKTDQRFDVVVASHVIEHLARDEGYDLLRRLEAMARAILYIETPFGFISQDDSDGNAWQRHFSGWFPEDFIARGYSVFGSGFRVLRGERGYSRKLPEAVTRGLDRLGQWYLFRHPRWAGAISAIRLVDSQGNFRLV